jgi:hypothetical protein
MHPPTTRVIFFSITYMFIISCKNFLSFLQSTFDISINCIFNFLIHPNEKKIFLFISLKFYDDDENESDEDRKWECLINFIFLFVLFLSFSCYSMNLLRSSRHEKKKNHFIRKAKEERERESGKIYSITFFS